MDEFGEYTEKSTGIYNVACNDSLLILARRAKDKHLLEYVKRNLDLLPAYIEPDDTLFTLKSTRQDSGMQYYPSRYWANFLEYGWLSKDEKYRSYGVQLMEDGARRGKAESRNMLTRILLHSEIVENLPQGKSLERSETYFNPQFGLYRKNQLSQSTSLSSGATRFFKFQKGANSVIARITATFFGRRGRFIPERLEDQGSGKIRLAQSIEWGYVRPFDEKQADPSWSRMDHQSRDRAYMQQMGITSDVSISDSVELLIDMRGPEGMLYRIELIFPPVGRLETDSTSLVATAGAGVIQKSRECAYRLGQDVITVTGCFSEHLNGPALRGGEAQEADAFTVYCTGFAPDSRTLVFS
jgi:hypothetical protein